MSFGLAHLNIPVYGHKNSSKRFSMGMSFKAKLPMSCEENDNYLIGVNQIMWNFQFVHVFKIYFPEPTLYPQYTTWRIISGKSNHIRSHLFVSLRYNRCHLGLRPTITLSPTHSNACDLILIMGQLPYKCERVGLPFGKLTREM